MIINIVPIGTSKGVRIPKAVLEQCKVSGSVDLSVKGRAIILKPVKKTSAREGWEEACQQMHANGDDILLSADTLDLDSEGWEW